MVDYVGLNSDGYNVMCCVFCYKLFMFNFIVYLVICIIELIVSLIICVLSVWRIFVRI